MTGAGRPDRVLVVRCPTLLEDGEGGEALRRFVTVVEAVEAFCPWVAPVSAGVCSLPARGPARYFGGEERLTHLVAERVTAVAGVPAEVGVADGLFGALLAASEGRVVPPGQVSGFLAPYPVAALGDAALSELLTRLGIRTLGAFSALPEPHVLGRFGADGVTGHRVARGRSGELEGLRDPSFGRRVARVRTRTGDDVVATAAGRRGGAVRAVGFWGGAGDADERAAHSLAAVQSLLGPDGVVVPRLQGGRGPRERVRLVTWGPSEEDRDGDATLPEDDGRPWPGRIPPPAPALVHRAPRPAELADGDDEPVRVSGRGLLSAPPVQLSVDGDAWVPVVAWAGPWPTDERWWSRARRRGARLQVVTGATTGAVRGEVARLLVAERGHWWVEATYA